MIKSFKNTLWAGVGVVFTMAVTTAITQIAGGPIKVRVGGAVVRFFGQEQLMRVYSLEPGDIKPFVAPDADYIVSLIGGEEIDGDVTRFKDNHEVKSERSELIGYKRNDALSFSFQSTRVGATGVGSYFGAIDHDTQNFVGVLTTYAHDPHGTCLVTKFVAVIGEPSKAEGFLALANTAREENLLPALKSSTPDIDKKPPAGCGADKTA